MDQIVKNKKKLLPRNVFFVKDIKKIEKQANLLFHIKKHKLVQRVAQQTFLKIKENYPRKNYWLILCGNGNKGGSGYCLAKIAKNSNIKVFLLNFNQNKNLSKENKKFKDLWINSKEKIYSFNHHWPKKIDLIIDALFGTGLNKPITGLFKSIINMVNKKSIKKSIPIISIDIPSGLIANTGSTYPPVIQASNTITFTTMKPGLLTGKARNYVGKLHYNSIGLNKLLSKKKPCMYRYNITNIQKWIRPRKPCSYKSKNGRLLVIGGHYGMGGAIRITAEAALRSGTGIVRVLTHKSNILSLSISCPELIVYELTDKNVDSGLLWSEVVVIGPGMRNNKSGQKALIKIYNCRKKSVWDADALKFLSKNQNFCSNRILTPHPGEAAKLLYTTNNEIENDRIVAAKKMLKKYGGVILLKGSGSIIAYKKKIIFADVGNSSLASAGTGDLLAGIIASLLAQKLSCYKAACAGAVIHGTLADSIISKKYGTRGILARDLLNELNEFVN